MSSLASSIVSAGVTATAQLAARHHTPQTAVVHYVSEFTLAAKEEAHTNTFVVATNVLLNWAKEKSRLADFALRQESFGGDAFAPEAWAMHLQHREFAPNNDYRRYWHIDVSMQRRVGGFDVRVVVSHALEHSFVGWAPPAPDPSAPKFIYDWLTHQDLTLRSGQFPIAVLSPLQPGGGGSKKLKERISALKVSPDQVDQLARLVFDQNRALPVLVIHGEVNPVTFPLNPHRLQQLLLGTCYVVWAPPASGWGTAWFVNFPKGFDCRTNSVRLYQPGASKTTPGDSVRHRFFTEDQIRHHGGSAAFVSMIRDGLIRRLMAPKAGRISSCEDVMALRASEDFAKQRSRLKSTDEELALYMAEHQRLVEKNQLSDLLLQEADAELRRTTSELEALRPYAAEMAAQLEAAKTSTLSAQPDFSHTDLLLHFLKNETRVVDQLHAISVLYPDAVHLLPSAIRSAEAADQFEHVDQLRDLLFKLVKEYRDGLVSGKGNHEACRVFGRNDFTSKESENLSREGRSARTFDYNGERICMEQHLKIGVKDSEAHCLRVHFYWDSATHRIVIGHCGKHLPL